MHKLGYYFTKKVAKERHRWSEEQNSPNPFLCTFSFTKEKNIKEWCPSPLTPSLLLCMPDYTATDYTVLVAVYLLQLVVMLIHKTCQGNIE